MTIVFLYFCRPNEIYSFYMVVVAQLVRASDCDSEGRGFEPPRLPTKVPRFSGDFFFGMVLKHVQKIHAKSAGLPFILTGFRKSGLTKHYSNSCV